MPGGDRTGPRGLGPMTGRGLGFCAGFSPYFGRGMGMGRGRGWRHWYYATGLPGWARGGYAFPVGGYVDAPTTAQELDFLKNQASYFQETLNSVNERIQQLEKEHQEP